MASLGLPGLAGFWGEFPAILSAYQPANGLPVETFRGYMVVAAVGTVLAAGYLLWLLQRTAMGEPSEEFANDPEIVDVTPLEWASWTPFLFLIVLFGVAPGLIFEVTDPAVVESLNNCLQFENGCDGVADATTAALGLNLMLAQLAQEVGFVRPAIDWHAVAPELTLLAFGALVTVMDIVWLERGRRLTSSVASIALLVTMIPIITLALDGEDRVMFGGAFVVDNYALVMKAMFLLAGYVVVLLSTNYVAEGDYWENEYYGLLLSSILGMVLMASARDLITVFVALELLSIPAYMLATWRKRDLKSNEAGLKYYLMGVFASAIMLYGMSLLYGGAGSTLLTDINNAVSVDGSPSAIVVMGVIFVIIGFAFKVSAFPFHTWAPDTYEGAPTPVTAFLSVASKAAGFVALLNLLFVGFFGRDDVYEPLIWILAAASMTVGNLIALRQTNLVRMLAYSGVAQAGYMLAPLAVASDVGDAALTATVTYLLVYAAMNLGAFAIVLAVARKTRSAEIDSFKGLFGYAPGLTIAMTVFLFSLAGIPPLGGWWAKFRVMEAVIDAESASGVVLGVFVAVNSVIALYYYARIGLGMWAEDAPDGDTTPIRVPASLVSALAITVALTIAFGVYPPLVSEFDVTLLAGGLGG